eukprot:2796311-Lingulodinium_polyedra.AAC.1
MASEASTSSGASAAPAQRWTWPAACGSSASAAQPACRSERSWKGGEATAARRPRSRRPPRC